MKKILFTITLTTIITMGFSQQTPQQIADIWKQIELGSAKYDDCADTVWQLINQNLELTKQDPVANAIWHSCMGQFLREYYQGNRWDIQNRTHIADETPADFKEWDAKTLEQRTREEYLASLEHADMLKAVDAKSYTVLLQKNEKRLQVKTLYEVLAYRTLEYLVSDLRDERPDRSLPKELLWNNIQFLGMPLSVTPASSVLEMILSIYQDLTSYHLTRRQEKDFIMLTIERYDFMRGQGLAPDNSLDWYIQHLEEWSKECESMQGYGYIAYKIGSLYMNRYNEQTIRERYDEYALSAHRDDLVKAESWLKIAVNASGSSLYKEEVNRAVSQLYERTISVSPFAHRNSCFPTGSPSLWRISFANCQKMYVKVLKATSVSGWKNNNQLMEYITAAKAVYQEVVDLLDEEDMINHTGLYVMPELPAGAYWLLVSDQPFSKWDAHTPRECNHFQIGDIEVMRRSTEHGLEILVLHQQTGKPLSNAKVTMTTNNNQTVVKTTDNDGFCRFEFLNKGRYSGSKDFKVSWHGQMLDVGGFSWWELGEKKGEERINAHLFTDRTLYRPAQTVYFKGIFEYIFKDDHSVLLADTPVKVVLKDVNYQDVEEMELRTNEFGSVSGEFTLPEGGLTGTYQMFVYVGEQSFCHTISVEEYKLPAFEVEVEMPEETFSIGQEVMVKGSAMALAGYPLDGASVSYRVTRTTSFPWWRSYYWIPTPEPLTVAQGTLQTDDDGHFQIIFPTEEDMALRRYIPLYRYEVLVDVTDINGETHSGSTVVCVSSRNLLLSCDMPSDIAANKTDNRYRISLTNTAGKAQNGMVRYEVFRLQTPDQYKSYAIAPSDVMISDTNLIQKKFPWIAFHGELKFENWSAVSIQKGTIQVSKDTAAYFTFPDLQNLPDGYYKVLLSTEDDHGNRIESEDYTHIYQEGSKKCTAYKQLWAVMDNSVNVGETLTVTVGSILPDAYVLCEIYAHNEKVFAKWITLHGSTQTITYPVTTADMGGLNVHLLCASQYELTEEFRTVSVTDDRKDIRFEFLRFRDKTLPGSPEEYQIRLTDKDGKPLSAELLCSMYDMALDALGSRNDHSLSFFVPWNRIQANFQAFNFGRFFSKYNYRDLNLAYSLFLTRDWLRFSAASCTRNYGKMMAVRGNRSEGVQTIVDGVRLSNSDVDYVELAVEESVDMAVSYEWGDSAPMAAKAVAQSAAGGASDSPAEQLRTNFAETAFFYPQLRTDERGDVFISFTMPDALTKWKMQGVAHNPDLQCGRFEKFVQTAKDVMIVPNAPRFLREGDTMDFSAKVVNMSGRNICGYVTLQMFNAVNNQPVSMVMRDSDRRDVPWRVSTDGTQQYDVPVGTSSEIHFRIVVPSDVPAVTYRIVAHNTDPQDVVGDGEEKTLPVLTNRMMVTETMPFYISGKGS